jgi:lysozyme
MARAPQPIHPQPAPSNFKRGTLAAVVGASAAAILFVATPAEESGRQVKATVAADGTATVTHLRGKQYRSAYLDIVGVPTACDGITKNIRLGQTYTEAQCTAMLERELVIHATGVMNCTPNLRRPEAVHQRVAAVLLAYNIGVGGYCKSTVDRRFDAGNWAGACDAFLMWNKAGGREVRGLTLRRKRERVECYRGLPG